ARALAQLLATCRAHVNLIPYNSIEGLPYDRPDPHAVGRFAAILRKANISVTVRKTKGGAIDAACGQLRRRLTQVDDQLVGLEHSLDPDQRLVSASSASKSLR